MNTYRKNAVTAGILFIAAIITGVLSVILTHSINASNFLAITDPQITQYILATLLIILMAIACVGIALALYPILKQTHPSLALTSVAFRTIEATCFILAAVTQFKLVSLHQLAQITPADQLPTLQLLSSQLFAEQNWLAGVAGAIAFCLGALAYYFIFIKTSSIPRWLSIWGFIAILAHLTSIILIIFSAESNSPINMLLNLPIFLNELTLAFWLIFKGIKSSN
jgi:hypothetical protein